MVSYDDKIKNKSLSSFFKKSSEQLVIGIILDNKKISVVGIKFQLYSRYKKEYSISRIKSIIIKANQAYKNLVGSEMIIEHNGYYSWREH